MAYTTTTTTAHSSNILASALSLLAKPFVGFWNLLILMAESGPRMEQVRRLNDMSDEQLAAKGTTRTAEVQRIFGHGMYL